VRDADERFHREWLGLAQPVEGLVFSVLALADAQIAPKVRAGVTAELEAQLENLDTAPALRDVRAFFETFLGYSRPGMLVDRDDLPKEISFYAPEGRQEIRPSFAIARGPFDAVADDPFAQFEESSANASRELALPTSAASPYIAVVWDLASDAGASAVDVDLDKSETATGTWRYPPTAKLERLLRHTGIPIGFLSNGRELRVVYAPTGEASAHLTFRFKDLAQRAGRPLVAALELIFHAQRTYTAAPEFTFEGLLRESRLRQADVTKDLAAQVFEAVEILLEGFEHSAARDCVGDRIDWLRAALEEPDDHLYQGILSVILRLVFVLYAEDQGLLPVQHRTYADHLSVLGLYERLADDAGTHPESMHLRFGAYGRLVAVFRAMFLGVEHGSDSNEPLRLPPRRGRLFDPSAFPFLEGGLPNWTAAITLPEERAAVQLPSIDDDTVYRVLHRLVVFKGQRLSYRSLDVEQIGAVYESLMGYHVLRVESAAVRLGSDRVWAETGTVQAMKPADRQRFWKETCGLSTSGQEKAEAAMRSAADAASLGDELSELAPGGKAEKTRHRAAAGRLVLQPGEERRRTGSHYTPRWLSEKVAKRTLEPILACLGEDRTAEQILALKICDPAMGSGAFLVATCRLLAEEVLAAWDRAGERAALTEEHGDAVLHARRLVAQRCLYGVDKNAAAVELAKLSLWLVTLSKELPFTFVDHALRHGDSLVGLDLEQIRSFHWEPGEQLETCRRVLDDALGQALEHRSRILALANNEDAASQREKQRLLEYAEQATERIRMIADVCVGAFFAGTGERGRDAERGARLQVVRRLLDGDETAGESLKTMAASIRARHAPFHWMIEFPEIFYEERPDPLDAGGVNGAAFMDAFVGNPPFLSGSVIASALGKEYADWLYATTLGAKGKTDLVAYFFRKCASLIGLHGLMGFIATKTIQEGDTRTSGLRWLIAHGWRVLAASRDVQWPGGANVTVSFVHVGTGTVAANETPAWLDGDGVPFINSRLQAAPERDPPIELRENSSVAFHGWEVGGEGFVLSERERRLLLSQDGKNADVILGYLGGEEVNTDPQQRNHRHVIAFGDATREEAERYPGPLAWLHDRVHAQRQTSNRKAKREYWWRFAERQPSLTAGLAGLSRCLVCSSVSKHLVFAFVPTSLVFSDRLWVFTRDDIALFGSLQARVHEVWARRFSSRLEKRLKYTASRCFVTFPLPIDMLDTVASAGGRLYEARAFYMIDTDQGLTKTYNALKDPTNNEPRVVELRCLHEEMDRAVLDAYGWTDIPVPAFCPTTDEDRAALQYFEDEVIDRLYLLNAERAEEEKRLGSKVKGKTVPKKPSKSASANPSESSDDDGQQELF
jgi:type I restriction-modification system DNA methylase subunit